MDRKRHIRTLLTIQCIDQRHSLDKDQQIQQMGTIYSAAQVTIIACAGVDLTHGLPGVSFERPQLCAVERIGRFTLALRPSRDIDEILRSSWASRAWTFQEGFLSKRRLFFTNTQLVYACEHSIAYEGQPESLDQGPKISESLRYGGLFPLNTHHRVNFIPWVLKSTVVASYASSRTPSTPSYAL